MIPVLNAAAILLIGYIGLHLPRSYLLFYVFAAIILARIYWFGHDRSSHALAHKVRTTVLLVLFSISYAVGMAVWGFWTWPSDALDLINSLILPGLLFLVGAQVGEINRRWPTSILLSYTFGGLIYGLGALVVARESWWNVSQIFPLTIQVPWASAVEMNVRSVEQTAYPALLLLAPALCMLTTQVTSRLRSFGILFLIISAFGAHVVWSLNGRLGWLTLALSLFPLLGSWLMRLKAHSVRLRRHIILIALGVIASLGLLNRLPGLGRIQESPLWSQGLCDERFSTFGSMLMRLHLAPWGGRALRVSYTLCGKNDATALLSSTGGLINVVHNVILEIYYNVGWLPVGLLLAALIPNLLIVARGFWRRPSCYDWQMVLRWCWFCFVSFQWLFQPLLYSDGLLFYFSFFVLGLFSSEACCGFLSPCRAKIGQSTGSL